MEALPQPPGQVTRGELADLRTLLPGGSLPKS